MHKKSLMLIFLSILFFSLGNVSALWPFDLINSKLTGNAVLSSDVKLPNYANCFDSDLGIFSEIKGTVTYNRTIFGKKYSTRYNYTDQCGGKNKKDILTEYYCIKGNVASTTIECKSGCDKGACIKTQQTCRDSDANVNYKDGKNIYLQGTADDRLSGVGSYYIDSCLLLNQTGPKSWQYVKVNSCEGSNCIMQEGFCSNGKVSNFAYSCPSGMKCQNGACLYQVSSNSCNQKNFSMAVVIFAKNESDITPILVSNLNMAKSKFAHSFHEATRHYATMDTSYPIKTVINDTLDFASWTSSDFNFAITNSFYNNNPDTFDFIVLYLVGIPEENRVGVAEFNLRVRNYVTNIGVAINDDSYIGDPPRNFGGDKQLKAIVNLGGDSGFENNLTLNDSFDFNGTQQALLHEIGHTWGVYVGDDFAAGQNDAQIEIKQQGIHFYRGLNNPYYTSDALGADHWISNGDGTFRRTLEEQSENLGNPISNYHPLMLYFMGLLPESEYSVNYSLFNAGIMENFDPFRATPYKNVSVNDIVRVEGLRGCFETELMSIKNCFPGVYEEKLPRRYGNESRRIEIISNNGSTCFTKFTISASESRNALGLFMNCNIPQNFISKRALTSENMRYYSRSGYCTGPLLDLLG